MARKKWTPKTELTEALVKSREKRKWQVSYRRYVLERMPCEAYAPYFGLDIETLRRWFELQFDGSLTWDNFGKAWQFDHIVPTTCFDFNNQDDLKLCWSFINMRAGAITQEGEAGHSADLLAAKPYFEELAARTNYSLAHKMVAKLDSLAHAARPIEPAIAFLSEKQPVFEQIALFSNEEFNRLNQGVTAADILLEREILKKFG